jgi:hypothetical protein
LSPEKRDLIGPLLRQQAVLAHVSELALRSNNLDEILPEVCRLVGDALGTDLAKVMELPEDGITLLVRAGVGWTPGVVGEVKVKAEKDSSGGYALKTGRPVISVNVDTETRFHYADFLKDNGVKALINVVITGAENKQPYGILQVDSRTPRDFTDEDIAFLRSYANLLDAAVERLNALRELREVNEMLGSRVADRTHALEKEQRDRAVVEEKLRQSQKMEAVGQLTGGLAHDFNNMLVGIMGNIELMQLRIAQGRTDDIARYAEGTMAAGRRAAALTHRLLAFSRRQTLAPEPSDVNRLVSSPVIHANGTCATIARSIIRCASCGFVAHSTSSGTFAASGVRCRPPTPWANTVPDPSAHGRGHSRTTGTRLSGSSRYVRPCRCTAAAPQPNAYLS